MIKFLYRITDNPFILASVGAFMLSDLCAGVRMDDTKFLFRLGLGLGLLCISIFIVQNRHRR